MAETSTQVKLKGRVTAYRFFIKACIEEHKEKYPGEPVNFGEISSQCAEAWKNMNDVQKAPFDILAEEDRIRYKIELEAPVAAAAAAAYALKHPKKDPNLPRKAKQAFIFLYMERQPALIVAHPDWKIKQVCEELGRLWKDMSEEEKRPYVEQHEADQQRYEQEMKDYKAQGQSSQASSATASLVNSDDSSDEEVYD